MMTIWEKAEDFQQEDVQRIIAQSEQAAKGCTVFFGDSLIQKFPLHEYFANPNFYNCGCRGATTDFLLHLQPYAVKAYHPSRVVFLAGVNDLNARWQFPRLEVAFNVYKLIEIMRLDNPDLHIDVISPLPIRDGSFASSPCCDNTQLRLLGDEIRQNVLEFTNTSYLNLFPFFLDKEGQLKIDYQEDGVHLSPRGYDVFASLLKEKL